MSEQTESAREYEALRVDRRTLPRVRPLIEEFAATGQTAYSAEQLERLTWDSLATPLFALWVAVEKGGVEPLGFVSATVRPGDMGPEVYVSAAYARPRLPRAASAVALRALRRWAKAWGVQRMVARTFRASANGLAEAKAWEKFGFRFDSALMVAPVEETDGRWE